MRYLLLFVIFLSFSCNEKDTVPSDPRAKSDVEIMNFYNRQLRQEQVMDTLYEDLSKYKQWAEGSSGESKAMVSIVQGLRNSHRGLYHLGIKNYEKAMELLKTSSADSLRAKALHGIGNNSMRLGDYSRSVKNYYDALTIYESLGDTIGMGLVQNGLGNVYFQMGQVEEAKSHIKTALDLLQDHKANSSYLAAAHTLANIYGSLGKFDKALQIDEMGIRVSDSLKMLKMKASFLDNKANCFMFMRQMDSAYYYFNQCLALDIQSGNGKQIADTYSNLAYYHMMQKNYPEAERHINMSIKILDSLGSKPNLEKSYDILSMIYTNRNAYKKAYVVQLKRAENNQMMLKEKEAAALSEYKVLYETQKKEAKIEVLELENKVRKLALQKQEQKIMRQWILAGSLTLLLLFMVVASYYWKNNQKLKNRLEREMAIKQTEEAERVRMAKDIHDDLGSGLSKINFLSEIISQKAVGIPEIETHATSIKETARGIVENMRNLIWVLNPLNTTLASLVARIREYTTEFLEDYDIEIEYEIPQDIPNEKIPSEVHRALFLVVKEAIHNITKHARATKIWFAITLLDDSFKIVIQDNGRGFEFEKNSGNGLRNMKGRMEDVNGAFSVESSEGKGTKVDIEIKTEKLFSPA